MTKRPKVQIMFETGILIDQLCELEEVTRGDYTRRSVYQFGLKGLEADFLLSPKGVLEITGASYREFADGLEIINKRFPNSITGFKIGKRTAAKMNSSELSFLIKSLRSLDAEFAFVPFPKGSIECQVREDKISELTRMIATYVSVLLFSLKQTARCPEGLKGFAETYRKWAVEKVLPDLSHIVNIYSQAYGGETVEKAIENLQTAVASIHETKRS